MVVEKQRFLYGSDVSAPTIPVPRSLFPSFISRKVRKVFSFLAIEKSINRRIEKSLPLCLCASVWLISNPPKASQAAVAGGDRPTFANFADFANFA